MDLFSLELNVFESLKELFKIKWPHVCHKQHETKKTCEEVKQEVSSQWARLYLLSWFLVFKVFYLWSCHVTWPAFILSCGFHQWLSGMIMDSSTFSRLHLVSERRVDACIKKMFVCLQMFSAHWHLTRCCVNITVILYQLHRGPTCCTEE